MEDYLFIYRMQVLKPPPQMLRQKFLFFKETPQILLAKNRHDTKEIIIINPLKIASVTLRISFYFQGAFAWHLLL